MGDDYAWRIRAEAALRCCESNHQPAYRRGRVAGQRDVERDCQLAYANGMRHGVLRALIVVAALGLCALTLRGRGR